MVFYFPFSLFTLPDFKGLWPISFPFSLSFVPFSVIN